MKSAQTVLKIPFSARQDSSSSARSAPFRCFFFNVFGNSSHFINPWHTSTATACISLQVHSNPQRQSHRPTILEIPEGFFQHGTPHVLARDKLELFAVLCIETSHYVSFIKYGPKSQDWIFFDSMADRQGKWLAFAPCFVTCVLYVWFLFFQMHSLLLTFPLSACLSGERDGFNIPEVQACPEVGMYLEMSPAELANQVPRDMKGVAKRLFCDAYMYLYQSSSMCLYR